MTELVFRHLVLAGAGVGAVLGAALLLRVAASRDAVLRYRIMVIVLVGAMLLLPLQAMTAELAPRPIVATLRDSKPASLPSEGTAPTSTDQRATALPAARSAPGLPHSTTSESAVGGVGGVGLASALLAVYIAGVVIVLGVHGVRAWAVHRLLRRARPVTDARLMGLWRRVVGPCGRRPALLECEGLHAPACRALGRAVVFVPSTASGLGDDTLDSALRHELIHIRRRDGIVAALASGTCAVLWFQPLAWVFAWVLRADREHSCDALVVRSTRMPRTYAMALLRFCETDATGRRVESLMGFESARSVHRRISMLAHALHPVARNRRVLLLGAGLACLASASVAHALLTAAAGPGPALNSAPFGNDSKSTGAEKPSAARMTSEIRAAVSGRSDAEVYERLVRRRLIVPDGLGAGDRLWGFAVPFEPGVGVRTEGAFVVDEETVLAATDVRAEGDTVRGKRLRVSLPDGSKLRAVFEGRSVKLEPDAKGNDRILVTGGSVSIMDEGGVCRVRMVPVGDSAADATIVVNTTIETGKTVLELGAADQLMLLSARLDTRTGVPEGERQPPHGAVRWSVATPQQGTGACEVKMQWHYERTRVPRPDGC